MPQHTGWKQNFQPIFNRAEGGRKHSKEDSMGIDLAYALGTQPGGGGGQGSSLMTFLPIIFIFVIFYFLLIRPQQKQKKEHQNLLSSLKVGDNVLTAGGIYGRVTGLKDDKVTVEISDKVRVKVNRGHISGVVKQDVLKAD
jgi:preprotein translocase subunit YajC